MVRKTSNYKLEDIACVHNIYGIWVNGRMITLTHNPRHQMWRVV